MLYPQYNNPLHIKWRNGDENDPYIAIEQSHKIVNNIVVLKEIPDEFEGVTINEYLSTQSITPQSNQFYIDYNTGLLTFNPSENGKTIIVSYKGRGMVYYPAERIYLHTEGSIDVVKNIQNLIDSGKDGIETLQLLDEKMDKIDDAIDDINQAVINANQASSTISEAVDNANSSIEIANNAITIAQQNSNSAKENGDYAKVQGNHAKEQGDYAKNKAEYALSQGNQAKIYSDQAKVIVDGYVFKGSWNYQTDYSKNNIVELHGSTYICIADNTNYQPPNESFWSLIAKKGADGTGSVDSINGQSGTVVINHSDVGAIGIAEKGKTLGVATLDQNRKIPTSQIPEISIDNITGLETSLLAKKDGTLQANLNADMVDGKHADELSVLKPLGAGYSLDNGSTRATLGEKAVDFSYTDQADKGAFGKWSFAEGRDTTTGKGDTFYECDVTLDRENTRLVVANVDLSQKSDVWAVKVYSTSSGKEEDEILSSSITYSSPNSYIPLHYLPQFSDVEGINLLNSQQEMLNLDDVFGTPSVFIRYYGHAEGYGTNANGTSSHAEGNNTTASGEYSHAEGSYTRASGASAHSEGDGTKAEGWAAHSEGFFAKASGDTSHAEGYFTTANGFRSHAEGSSTTASGNGSHAEGYVTTASGNSSHAEGYGTTASGDYSHAGGKDTKASGACQRAIGKANINDTCEEYVFIIGNGADDANRSNALAIDWDGVIHGGLDRMKFAVIVSDVDNNPTTVEYKRQDDKLYMRRVATNPDSNGFYQTITESYYREDGTTKLKDIVFTLAYNSTGLVTSSNGGVETYV